MSYDLDASEKEPLLCDAASYDVSGYNGFDSANAATVDNSLNVAEITNTPDANSQLKVYKRRWYIMVLFSLVYMIQSSIWNTWGPLTNSAEVAFGWSLHDIALLTNWGCIMYVSSTVFFSWMMDVKGLLFFVLITISCLLSRISMVL